MNIKYAINGFGRIGRNVVRAAAANPNLELVGVNDLTDATTLAHLLKYDSVHGKFEGEVRAEENALIINGKKVKVTAEKDPKNLPWSALGVDVVLECTGVFTKREKAALHLEAGAKNVIISAPANDADLTVVCGVNQNLFNKETHKVISNGSCTTNCLAPVAKVILENFGIVKGLMTTIHSYTNDQQILDLPHKDLRRARAAGMSMIPTSTGAAKAMSLVIPELKGKLDGLAVRVPTPNVSLVDFVCEVERDATAADINNALVNAAKGPLKGFLDVCDEPLVSIDFKGNPASSIVDLQSTMVIGNKMIKVLSWYDNEMGFSYRMVDLLKLMAK
ncbi:MAG: type I glyceraldehyde-3-phosphate dehydrogenase [Proteobacteria bacterium]|nr:type I glyceraldehyde-3-phosphate dehydrogenase [Pseudomonadota bacterium]